MFSKEVDGLITALEYTDRVVCERSFKVGAAKDPILKKAYDAQLSLGDKAFKMLTEASSVDGGLSDSGDQLYGLLKKAGLSHERIRDEMLAIKASNFGDDFDRVRGNIRRIVLANNILAGAKRPRRT